MEQDFIIILISHLGNMKGETSNNQGIEIAEEAPVFCSSNFCACCPRKTKRKVLEDYYEIGRVIGKGGYGTIYRGRRKSDLKYVILKHIAKSRLIMTRNENDELIPLEIDILQRVKNISKVSTIIDYFEKSDSFVIVLENTGSSMDLFDYISEKKVIEECEAKHIFKQVVEIIVEIHRHGLTHRDIKDENILIDKYGNIELIDFGSASYISQLEQTEFEGTMLYCPPEFVRNRKYDYEEAAVWSLGILLYDMVTGDIPFNNEQDIVDWNDESLQNDEQNLSQDCMKLIRMCLRNDQNERIKLNDILKHTWFNNEADSDEYVDTSVVLNSYDC